MEGPKLNLSENPEEIKESPPKKKKKAEKELKKAPTLIVEKSTSVFTTELDIA